MAGTQVAIINSSTVLSDDQVNAVVPALQVQVHRDFEPVWGIDADLAFVPTGGNPSPGSWWLVIVDDSDQAGALGYHETTDQGLPLAYVFVRTTMQDGVEWSVTASHELLEMLADPEINLTVFIQQTDTTGTLFAYEVCDACEADQYGYNIDGVLVSDFVYPSWFESFRQPGSTQFDFQNQLQATVPALLPGGYIGAFDVGTGTGWHQVTAMRHHRANGMRAVHAPQDSRRDRRATPRVEWSRSTVKFRKSR